MPPRDELGQGELCLLAARQRSGVLTRDIARQVEHAEQRPQHALLGVRLLAHVRQHGRAGADTLVLLRVVAERDAMADAERAGVGGALAGEDAQQARLARSVQTHHQQTLVALHLERDVVKDQWSAITLGEAGAMQHDPPAVRRLGKVDLDLALAPRRGDPDRLHPLDSSEDRLSLLGPLLGLPPHHLREQAQPLDLRLLTVGQRGEALFLALARLLILRIGAAVLDQSARIEMQHTRDRGVEEDEVVADHDDLAAIVAQEVHQPRLGVAVEVVRRFIEKQELRVCEQHARQLNPPALSAGEDADR